MPLGVTRYVTVGRLRGGANEKNEDEVGEGIQASGVDRKDIFITSKVWSTFHDRVEEGLDATVRTTNH
jgi:diketogulonate reductase-like aldo/keto reductase